MPSMDVDGVRYEITEGRNLLHACLSHGLDLPYFCWHPSLGSVGACRQCAVVQYKDESDATGKLTMACMTPATDGARLSIRAEEAVKFRASVIEWLMLNHPHDCPVCEEGGECHLQDMTVMTGHTFRRYRGRKRTFRNQYLGPLVNHEMNRCITCYRCVRFYRDYAGGRDLDAFGSRDRLYFGRAEDGVLESEFAGNLVEVCPTGVFTDKPFSATYTRKWDLTSAPSVCHGCGLGCNTLPGERYGILKRVHNRYHAEINSYFLCDRGRFGAGFVNAQERLRRPGSRREDGSFDELTVEEATRRGGALLRQRRVAAVGSPRASMEANFLLRRLAGAERFCAGFAAHEAPVMAAVTRALAADGVRVPTLREVEDADAVLVLGEDVANSAPRLALALRQTVRNSSFDLARKASIPVWQDAGVRGHAGDLLTPLLQATALPTRLDDVTRAHIHLLPEEVARLGQAIAHALDGAHPQPGGLSDEQRGFAAAAAEILAAAERPLVISGTGAGSAAVVDAALAVTTALGGRDRAGNAGSPGLHLVVPECNSLGAWLLGGTTLEEVLDLAEAGEIDTLLVVENELSRRVGRERVQRALQRLDVIVLDSLETWTAGHADLVLPAAPFAEADGTWINNEGRAQRFFRVYPAPGAVAPSWRWLIELARAAGDDAEAAVAGLQHVDDVGEALAGAHPALAAVAEASPHHPRPGPGATRVPRQPHRYSGRTAMYAGINVHEPRPPEDDESPLAFSMEGARPRDPGTLLTYAWAPGWNSNQSIFKFQAEVAGPLRGGPAGVRIAMREAADALGAIERSQSERTASGRESGFLTIPLQDVFASDELSFHAAAIRQRAPRPWVALSPGDAERLGVGPGGGVRVADGRGGTASLAARIEPHLPAGAVGLVQGASGDLPVIPGAPLELDADPDYLPPDDGVIARG